MDSNEFDYPINRKCLASIDYQTSTFVSNIIKTISMRYLFVHIAILLLTLLNISCKKKTHFEVSEAAGSEILFNSNWEFIIDTFDFSCPADLSFISNGLWEKVSLPHTPVIEPKIVNNQWQGDCWYRKAIDIQSNWKDKRIFVRFEGAMNTAEVWVNENKKITHHGGYLPFVIDVTEDLQTNRQNILYVKLNNEDNAITGPKLLKELDFNMYGGLYRDVVLIVKNAVHITDEQYANRTAGGGVFVSYPKVNSELSTVSVKPQQIHFHSSQLLDVFQ